jgi:shikimate kinase
MSSVLNDSSSLGNVIFIGFMGSGKTTIGRKIAKHFGRLFFDTDLLIESRENMKILDMFKQHGEKYFRNIEREISELIQNSIHNSIISVGGGFPTAVSSLQKLGFVIYLDIDFDFMISEAKKYPAELEKRPLLENLDEAKRIYDFRKNIYKSQADKVFTINHNNYETIADEVINFLKKQKGV